MPLSASQGRRSSPAAARAATLLVVAEDPRRRTALAGTFAAHGCQVREAAAGAAAVAVLAHAPCDAVLLDLTTPGARGLDALAAIRRSGAGRDVPVIVVTAEGDGEAAGDALDLGADDYIPTPLNASVALARIRAQLARPTTGRALAHRAVAPRPGPVTSPGTRGDDREQPRGTALLAEDDAEVRLFVRDVLERDGYTVVDAARGDLALDAATRLGAIDLLVTDLVMPGMGGLTLWTALHAARPGLPAVFMSGHDPGGLGQPAGLPVLQKPFATNDFLAAVRRARRSQPAPPVTGGRCE